MAIVLLETLTAASKARHILFERSSRELHFGSKNNRQNFLELTLANQREMPYENARRDINFVLVKFSVNSRKNSKINMGSFETLF